MTVVEMRRFEIGDRVVRRHDPLMRNDVGVVVDIGARPGTIGRVPRAYVRWDASGYPAWIDDRELDPAPATPAPEGEE